MKHHTTASQEQNQEDEQAVQGMNKDEPNSPVEEEVVDNEPIEDQS